jgi:tetratricopeptide (TPR) repeat protein
MADNYIAKKKFDEGVAAYLKGEFKSSIKLLSKALRHDPEFALAYLIRGAASLKLDDVKKAISDLDRAVQIDPDFAHAFHLRGLAYEKAGNAANAYCDFDRAMEIDPDLSAAYRGRDCIMDRPVEDCSEIEEFDMTDHLAALRVAQFIGDGMSRSSN